MSVGWLKVRRTDYERLKAKKLYHMRYLGGCDLQVAGYRSESEVRANGQR